ESRQARRCGRTRRAERVDRRQSVPRIRPDRARRRTRGAGEVRRAKGSCCGDEILRWVERRGNGGSAQDLAAQRHARLEPGARLADARNGPLMDRWKRIEELFEQALTWQPASRAARLAAACGDDIGLRREIEELLAQHDRSDPLLDGRAWIEDVLEPGT